MSSVVQRLVQPQEVVAFLQNPWFKPGTSERTIKLYTEDVNYRRRVLSMSMSGSRLMSAFGSTWFDNIWWDNANPRPAFEANGVNPPNLEHIKRVLAHNPYELILTFGLHARTGVQNALESLHGRVKAIEYMENHVMHCHHPNARFRGQGDINNFALAVKRKTV